MIRQYGPGRHRLEMLAGRLRPVGTVPIGTIARVRISRHDGKTRALMVLAWLPREITAARAGYWTPGPTWHPPESRYMARMGHLALCRDLRTGKTVLIAEQYLATDDD